MREFLKAALYEFLYWTLGVLMIFTHSMRVVGRSRIPRTGPVLLFGNHTSFLDIIVAGIACRRRVYFLARKTLARSKTLAFIMRFYDTTLIDQEGFGRAGLQGIANQLAQDQVVMVYPEGERCRDGDLARFKPGITLLLRKVKVPIVPIGVAGVFETLPRWRRWPSFAPPFLEWGPQRIGVCVGEPIPPECFEKLAREEMLDLLYNKLKWCVESAERLRAPRGH